MIKMKNRYSGNNYRVMLNILKLNLIFTGITIQQDNYNMPKLTLRETNGLTDGNNLKQ